MAASMFVGKAHSWGYRRNHSSWKYCWLGTLRRSCGQTHVLGPEMSERYLQKQIQTVSSKFTYY